jgi:hypothetical protein
VDRTEFSHMPTDDVLTFALNKKGATALETELAQRLAAAIEMIEEKDTAHGCDA